MRDGDSTAVAERLGWASDALHAAAVISAAHRLGVLTALEAGPVHADDLARDSQLDGHGCTVLLEALAAMGLVDASADGRFKPVVPELSALGVFARSADLLVEAVRSGRAPLECDIPAGSSRVYPDAVTYLATLLGAAADAVAKLLHGAGRILDVGAGAAQWSLALVRRDPRCRVTALDLAPVLAVTRRAVAEAGWPDQFEYMAGDAFEVSLPHAKYDLALLGNLCHLFDGPANRRLFHRLRPAIQDGGRIAIIDVLPAHDPDTQRSVQLYAAGLMTRTSSGGVHGEESYRAWLEEAGFLDIHVQEASRTLPISVVTGSA
ncbi:MAG TPA: methyltransferase [Jiangellaceae bacterium]|nr:methyltransferase [Jiangellaceae bacterium]